MRLSLINSVWNFAGSTYFGCAEPHFPLELLSARRPDQEFVCASC